MNAYEVVYIVRPDVATDQVEKLTKRFSESIQKQGGKIVRTEQWGLRTLAYRINKHRKGYYTMLAVEMPGSAVNEIERQLNLAEDIIRFLTIKVDAVDATPSFMMNKRDDADTDEDQAA
jgi:small subunit ribosomal protein S6